MEQVPNKSSQEDEEETKLQKIKKIVGKARPSKKRDVAADNIVELRGD